METNISDSTKEMTISEKFTDNKITFNFTSQEENDTLRDIAKFCDEEIKILIKSVKYKQIDEFLEDYNNEELFPEYTSTMLSNIAYISVYSSDYNISIKARVLLARYMNWYTS